MRFHAATAKRIETARSALSKRLRKNVDSAITSTALDFTTVSPESLVASHITSVANNLYFRHGLTLTPLGIAEEKKRAPTLDDLAGNVVRLWNDQAEDIDRRLGFPMRLKYDAGRLSLINSTMENFGRAVEVLLHCSVLEQGNVKSMQEQIPFATQDIEAAKGKVWLYDWMADLLFMMAVPESLVKRESSGRESRWERKLRKTKHGIAMKRQAFQRDLLAAITEADRQRLIKEFHRGIMDSHTEIERQVRATPGYRDFALLRWVHTWGPSIPAPKDQK